MKNVTTQTELNAAQDVAVYSIAPERVKELRRKLKHLGRKSLEDLKADFCDNYCKWPLICRDNECLINWHCDVCPLEEWKDGENRTN